MPDPVLPPRDAGRESNRGILAELLNFFSSFGEHLQALVALAGLESREAAGIYLRALVAGIAALVLLLFGYLLILIFVAFALAALLHWDWIWISLGLAVLHFLLVGACLFYLRARLKSPVFTATSAELRRDFAALKTYKP
jgi:uncharacterized membrane protein YqjE